MEKPTCADCAHFRPHYIKFDEDRYDLISCGHCVYPRLKHRQCGTPACVHFKPIPPEPESKP